MFLEFIYDKVIYKLYNNITPLLCRIIAKLFNKYSYSISILSVILQNAAKCGGDIKSRRLTLPILAMIGNILLANNISPLLCRIIAKLFIKYFIPSAFYQLYCKMRQNAGATLKVGALLCQDW